MLRWPCSSADAREAEKTSINRAAAVAAVDLVLKEILRHLHATAGAAVHDPGQGRRRAPIPHPPLGQEELELLREATEVPSTTPFSRLAAQRLLKGRRIALSMPESTDIQSRGSTSCASATPWWSFPDTF